MPPVRRAALPADVRMQVSEHPHLAEQYRQVMLNYQVADLLDARALGAGGTDRAEGFRRRAVRRREMGDQLLQEVLQSLPERQGPSAG